MPTTEEKIKGAMIGLIAALAVIALLLGASELCAQIATPTPTPTFDPVSVWQVEAWPTFTVTP